VMNPKPLAALKNFTVPFCICLFPYSPPTAGGIVPKNPDPKVQAARQCTRLLAIRSPFLEWLRASESVPGRVEPRPIGASPWGMLDACNRPQCHLVNRWWRLLRV